MKGVLGTTLIIILSIVFLVLPAHAIDFVSLELGILVQPVQYPCPVKPRTSQWAANDWDTVIVVQQRDIRDGDLTIAEVTAPNGRVFRRTSRWNRNASVGCDYLFVPILGTDAEAWLGSWRASILFNGRKVADATWEVVPARGGALAEYQADLQANPRSSRTHYRVGAAAAFAGQDALGEAELLEATKISPTWWYPYLALGRLYHRQGKKDQALEQFHKLKGLLMGRTAEPGTFTEYITAMLEDHLKQLD